MRNAFCITGKNGFQITFKNGFTVSVQFGPGNYSENYDRDIGRDEEACGEQGSDTAETAIIHPKDGMIPDPADGPEGDTVQGYQTIEQVWDRMVRVQAMRAEPQSSPKEGQMEWKWDIATALAVCQMGWHTEAERTVLTSAQAFISNVAREAHLQAQRNSTCRTCGHNPLTSTDAASPRKENDHG